MNIFNILENIYINPKSNWIEELENNMIQPFLINNWLSMNDQNVNICKYLDKYTFSLSGKKWLHLAWSVIPKRSQAPFCKYIKKADNDELYSELMQKIKKFLEIEGNDIDEFNLRLLPEIKKNISKYMIFFGMEKKIWKKYKLNYNDMKKIKI
jgi:hypothetical protein